jgi:hypothetical protein
VGLLDKAKDAAKVAGEKAKEGLAAGKEKVDETRTKRRISDLKEELGGIVYSQKAGSPPADADTQITKLVDEIREAEAQLQD